MLDSILDSIVLPEPCSDTRALLVSGFSSYRTALVAHPAVVTLMAELARTSRAQARLAERSIELVEGAGLSTRAAVDAHVTLVAYVLGFILREVSLPVTTGGAILVASPVLRRALTTLAQRSIDERFDVGLGLIRDGAQGAADRRRLAGWCSGR